MPDHPCRSQNEEIICRLLSKMDLKHSHGQLIFPVTMEGKGYSYMPDFILHDMSLNQRIPIIEAVQPEHITSGEILKIKAFLEQHGEEYVVIVVSPQHLISQIPEQTYNYLIPIEEQDQLVQILKTVIKHPSNEEKAI